MITDGIYFGLDEEVYHAQPRLSASGIKALRVSPATFWARSWLNPNPVELSEDQQQRKEMAKLLGRAYHCARLEPDQLHARFVRALDKRDYQALEGFVAGGTAYGEALGALGETKKKSGETVMDQATRLRDAGYKGPIWDLELATWETFRAGRVAIPAQFWTELLQDMDRIKAVPEIHGLLSGGEAEVSIFWTDQRGRPWKTRLDYLRPDGWADFKTFANAVGKNVLQVIMESFRFNGYHLQAAVQRVAMELVRAGQLEVHGGTAEQVQLIYAISDFSDGPLRCDYVWQEKAGVPNLWARQLQFFQPNRMAEAIAELERDGADADHLERARNFQKVAGDQAPTPTAWFQRALGEVEAAVRDFDTYSQVYEPGQPWLPFNPCGEITDADFPRPWLEGNY